MSSTGTGGMGTGGAAGAGGMGTGGMGTGGMGTGGAGGGGSMPCTVPADCPPTNNACITATCDAGQCGTAFVAAGTPTKNQQAGDCHVVQCDGAGSTVNAIDEKDAPDDGNDCTSDLCNAGTPTHVPIPAGTKCGQGMNMACDGNGACTGCVTASTCPGVDTECQTRTCNAGACGFSYAPAGTPVAMQSAGDCQKNTCNGAGKIVQAADDTDVPVDGNQCTSDVCTSGVPSNPPVAPGAACNQNDGLVCSGAGACVQCVDASTCPGQDTECQTRTCINNACGLGYAAAGTPLAMQTSGDCKKNTCDGTGGITTTSDDTDVPVDGNQCTSDVCTNGTPSNPPAAQNTACNQNGGKVCTGSGACVDCNTGAECASGVCSSNTCQAASCADGVKNGGETDVDCGGATCVACASGKTCLVGADCQTKVCTGGICQSPSVSSTTPADAATGVAVGATVAITFSVPMDQATLTAQTATGPCTGSIQLSTDDFITCLSFTAAAPTMSGGGAVATLVPAPALSYGATYKLRVTTAAKDQNGNALGATYAHTTGFTTSAPPDSCAGSVVISQVYGAGGNSGATYKNDFVELHNRGSAPVNLSGWSVQYASAAGTSWTATPLTGTIQPGGYFLVQQAGGANGIALPTPEVTGSIAMAAGAGKVALVSSTTALTGSCPSGGALVDMVGYGTTANCYEGSGPTPVPSTTQSVQRAGSACTDAGNNATDFALGNVAPRNGASAANVCAVCASNVTVNESDLPAEIDYCVLQFPLAITVATGQTTPLIYGRVYEAGVTDPAGANASVMAQVGYGPASVNPTTQSGWQWFSTTYNAQYGNNDEYQGTFTAPAAGTYRYTYRVSLDGAQWTYCDLNGAGSNAGLSFEITQLPVLTVTP
jgi:hypothetical protein